MTPVLRPFLTVLVLGLTLALAGCDSAEERAEKHYQSGMELLEQGDVDRALVEFRNVFQLNGKHKEARLAYARVQRDRGQLADAYGQYLRSVEQYPDEIESRRALAEMAIENGNWDEADRHGRAAQKLAPEDPTVKAIVVALDYRKARVDKDDAAAAAAAEAAAAILADDPDQLIARRVRIDHLANAGDLAGAMTEVEAAIATRPDLYEFQLMKLRLLAEQRDGDGVGAQLRTMFDRFPDNEEVQRLLISWYMERGDLDGAETLLRDIAAKKPGEPGPAMTVVQFLREARGADPARAELDRLVALGDGNAALYRATRAALDFDEGRADAAIAEMEALLADAEPSDTLRNIKVALARMLQATGNSVGARARVEEVLAEDPSHVAALKMRAEWLIEDDQPDAAILALRTALDQTPRDPEILILMGRAHERDGARELAGERYALAVEVSGRAAEESLLYAEFLTRTDRVDVAQGVLEDAVRVAPQNLDLLSALAETQMRLSDWPRTEGTLARIRALGTAEATAVANGLEAQLLLRQEKTDETISFLESLSAQGGSDTATAAAIVQTQVRAGRIAEARTWLDDRLAKTPDDPALRFLRAGIHVLEGENAQAEAGYRALIAEGAGGDRPTRALYGLLRADPARAADAMTLLDEGLARQPASVPLQLLKAAALEQAGDIDGAIAIYEPLYAQNGDNLVLANNLSSLISAHRDDAESLERAFAIARRLRGIEVPAFQDTYGWIESRRGNYDEALSHLEPAAEGLPDDPLVQFHLGMTYLAMDRKDDAKTVLQRVVDLAGPDSPLPQVARAREALAGLN